MYSRALTFLVTFALFLGTAHAAMAPACLDLFAGPIARNQPRPIDSIYDHSLKPYDNPTDRVLPRLRFWQFHDRFGVTRTSDGRVELIAKTEGLAQTLLADISAYTGVDAGTATFTSSGWRFFPTAAYDVTPMLPDVLRDRLEVPYKLDGPNCLGACLLAAGYAKNMVHIGGHEIEIWLKSPFVTEITDARGLKPGDILVVNGTNASGGTRFVHGAVYISPRLVLSKNGLDASEPMRLMDINELANMTLYLSPEYLATGHDVSRQLRAYRFSDVDQVLNQNRLDLPSSYADAQKDIDDFEKQVADMHTGQGSFEPLFKKLTILEIKWGGTLRRDLSSILHARLDDAEKSMLATPLQALLARLESLNASLTYASYDRGPH